jgi:hypothetical protein
MITTLYIKRHSDTGLLYFGKTTRDPMNYKGSGKYWNYHLKKHGAHIDTIWTMSFEDIVECQEFAEAFSEIFDIVENDAWANLTIETGLDGRAGQKGEKRKPLTDETKSKKSISMKDYWANGGHTVRTGWHHSEETKQKQSLAQTGVPKPWAKGKKRPDHSIAMTGRKDSDEVKKNKAEAAKLAWAKRKEQKEQE